MSAKTGINPEIFEPIMFRLVNKAGRVRVAK